MSFWPAAQTTTLTYKKPAPPPTHFVERDVMMALEEAAFKHNIYWNIRIKSRFYMGIYREPLHDRSSRLTNISAFIVFHWYTETWGSSLLCSVDNPALGLGKNFNRTSFSIRTLQQHNHFVFLLACHGIPDVWLTTLLTDLF